MADDDGGALPGISDIDVADSRRGDRCPGVLRLHQAADGGLARVRIPGGTLRTDQARALVALAVELGDEHLEITARGNVQVRGLPDSAGAELASRLSEAGLMPSTSHERVRNIVGSPMSGRDDAGLCDVRDSVRELDRRLCGDPTLARLSGRFLFALDDGRGDVTGMGADVAVVATAPDRLALLLAGVDSGLRVAPERAAEIMIAAARGFLAEVVERGLGVWRLSEIEHGVEAVSRRVLAQMPACERAASDERLGVAGRGEAAEPVGVLRQRDGTAAIGVIVPFGRLSAAAARRLVAAASAGGDTLVVTPWRGVVVPDLPVEEVPRWAAELGDHGLVADPSSPWRLVTACVGRPGCSSALADVRADARVLLPIGSTTRVHWSGCERRCGRPSGDVVDVVATGAGYEVRGPGEVSTRVARAADLSSAHELW